MKIQYWSDLHLEFKENAKYLMERKIKAIGEILILAGDITYWGDSYFAHPFFDKLSEKFKTVYMIPGNHEFYGGFDISILDQPVKINIRPNIFLVNNVVETIAGVDFFFTALWGIIKPQNEFYIESNMSDFHLIKRNGKTLTAKDYSQLCSASYHFLDNAIKDSKSKKKVVVTHHCPTEKANAKEFWKSQLNNAFVVELYDFIYHNPIDYWIFGHTHRNEPLVEINGTKVVSNQLGYLHLLEYRTFKIDACINL